MFVLVVFYVTEQVLVCVYFQVPAPNLQPRHYHCAAAFSLSPGITEVVMFGGDSTGGDAIADTTVLRFGECNGRLYIVLYCVLTQAIVIDKSLVTTGAPGKCP